MSYELHMNGVVTGSLNCFCLACSSFLRSQQEATDHVGTPDHEKNINAVQYSDKFKDEHIRKFKSGYYCEFCNILLPIASQVNLHVTEDAHKQNKGILLLKPMGNDVIAFNNVLIEENAWHGLIEGVCSLCNAEFEEESDHKIDASHYLNLILKPIQFGEGNAIYRHLDDTSVQCLTCNKLLAPFRMTKHFGDVEHHELFAKRRIETNGVCKEHETSVMEKDNETKSSKAIEEKSQTIKPNETNKSKIDNNINDTKSSLTKEEKSKTLKPNEPKKPEIDSNINDNKTSLTNEEKSKTRDSIELNTSKTVNNRNNKKIISAEEKSKILESIAKYQTKGININLETETAFCKKCSNVVTFEIAEIENHIENHSPAKIGNSDLLYPSNVDQKLNRVNINDKTTQSSDDVNSADVANESKKALTDKPNEDQSDSSDKNNNDSSDEEEYYTDDSSLSFNTQWRNKVKKVTEADEAKDFAKANNITYNGNINQSYCRVCEVHLPASFKSMKEHVLGATHKKTAGTKMASSVTKHENPGKHLKKETRMFIDTAYDLEGIFYHASLINEKFCVPRNSFYLILENNNSRLRCILCEISLPPYSDMEEHVKTRQHSLKFLDVPVIISEKTELIREVRPGLYHCAYCNLVVSGWTDMKQHLKCSDHREHKAVGEDRFRRHLPGLRRFQMQKEMEALAMMRLFNMF